MYIDYNMNQIHHQAKKNLLLYLGLEGVLRNQEVYLI